MDRTGPHRQFFEWCPHGTYNPSGCGSCGDIRDVFADRDREKARADDLERRLLDANAAMERRDKRIAELERIAVKMRLAISLHKLDVGGCYCDAIEFERGSGRDANGRECLVCEFGRTAEEIDRALKGETDAGE